MWEIHIQRRKDNDEDIYLCFIKKREKGVSEFCHILNKAELENLKYKIEYFLMEDKECHVSL